MYTSFFGFKENPFNLTPDPRYLFLSSYHKEALDYLLYGINERKGFITITGGIGTGKTTLCRALLSRLSSSTKSALIFNSFIKDRELLATINQEFGIETDPAAESNKDYTDALNSFLLENFSSGGNALLLIDEAQNLSHTVLEQIRMLSNLETEKEKLVQIVLVGQSELKELLVTPSLKQLDERITVRYDLKPLDRKDIRGYVEHRLVIAGSRGSLRFTNRAIKEIYAHSQGNPRRVNAVCDRSLLIAYAKEKRIISKGIAGKAIRDFRKDITIDPLVLGLSGRGVQSVAILLLFLIMAVGFAGWSFRKDILRQFSDNQKIAVATVRDTPPAPSKPEMKAASLFLDDPASLAGLFRLFDTTRSEINLDEDEAYLGLSSLSLKPEYYVMFKKPFRVRVSDSHSQSSLSYRYLLIRKLTADGAIAIDAGSNERPIMRDFILRHWDKKVSWVYPYKNKNIHLMKGMRVPDILGVQKALNSMGYLVEPTGIYDESTFPQVLRFQKDFGLLADGIVGPQTRALLYQMVE